MKIKRIISCMLAIGISLASISAYAMERAEFDRKMKKGIDYFNKGMYYEARDEFQWFCDYNWGKMNSGQQKYALDYLDGAKAKISALNSAPKYSASNVYVNGFLVKPWDELYVVGCDEAITLRTQPNVNAGKITSVPLTGSVSFLADAGNGFYKVSYLGKTGYVLASYLDYYEPQTVIGYATVVNCNSYITLRTEANTSASRITTIPYGARVAATWSTRNGFRVVHYNGYTGWVLDNYLYIY